jgi:hypothetical protein
MGTQKMQDFALISFPLKYLEKIHPCKVICSKLLLSRKTSGITRTFLHLTGQKLFNEQFLAFFLTVSNQQ